MAMVNVHQAKTHHHSRLLQEVEQGHAVVIVRSGVKIARLVARPAAAPGAMRGQIALAVDFDAPLFATTVPRCTFWGKGWALRPATPFMARPPDSGALAESQAENPLRVGGD